METLYPILGTDEDYVYNSTGSEISEMARSSSFMSNGRFYPTCRYTLFSGPDITSSKAAVLAPRGEVIFCKPPDYIVKIEYNLKSGNNPLRCKGIRGGKIWRVDLERLLLYQVYDVKGNLACLHEGRGCIKIYSFQFPIVFELEFGASLDIKITLIKHLKGNDPRQEGLHCIKCDGKRIPVYRNVWQPGEFKFRRVVLPEFEEFNRQFREKYFSTFLEGCVTPPTPPSIQQAGETFTAIIDSENTIDDTGLKFGFHNKCTGLTYWFQLVVTNQSTFIIGTDTLGLTTKFASYLYVNRTGYVRFRFKFSFVYENETKNPCAINQNNIAFAILDWHINDYLPTYIEQGGNFVITDKPSANVIVFNQGKSFTIPENGPFGEMILLVKESQYLWCQVMGAGLEDFSTGDPVIAETINTEIFSIEFLASA